MTDFTGSGGFTAEHLQAVGIFPQVIQFPLRAIELRVANEVAMEATLFGK